jgi:hypothetical protein
MLQRAGSDQRPPVPTKDVSSVEPTPLAPVVDELPAKSRRVSWADVQDELPPLPAPNSGAPLMSREISKASGYHRVHWKLPKRILDGKDKQAVSPPFEVCGLSFKVILTATKTEDEWGGWTFRKSKGKGKIELKCLDTVPSHFEAMDFGMSVGKAEKRRSKHNFADSATCGLPADDEEWHFKRYEDGQSFMICVEVRPPA